MIRPFDPKTDIPVLLRCLEDLRDQYGVNAERLVAAIKRYREKHAKEDNGALVASEVISRTSLQKFMAPPHARPKEGDRLLDIWNCVAEHPHYSKALSDAIGVKVEPPPRPDPITSPSEEAVLSQAMLRFLQREKEATKTQMEDLRKKYPGNYIMYRADLRPYKFPAEMSDGLRFRVSHLNIELVENDLLVTEDQNYPEKPFHMKTTGILFPYCQYGVFIAQAIVRNSFRLGVIQQEYSFRSDDCVEWFRGVILVASSEDLFPSTPFFCLRDDGKLETGLLPFDRIEHPEARLHLQHAHEKAAYQYKF